MKNKITDLQNHLMEQIEKLKDAEGEANIRLEINKTKAIAEIATVLVEAAKAEVNFIKITGEEYSESFFVQSQPTAKTPPLPKQLTTPELKQVPSTVETVEQKTVEKIATSDYKPSKLSQTTSKNDLKTHKKFTEQWE